PHRRHPEEPQPPKPSEPRLHTALGLPLSTPPVTDGFRNYPAHRTLRLPIFPRTHQPTNQTPRPIRRRCGRPHHLPLPALPNQRRSSSTNPGHPLPSSTRHQHLPTLLLPQRHLPFTNSRPRTTHTNP